MKLVGGAADGDLLRGTAEFPFLHGIRLKTGSSGAKAHIFVGCGRHG